MDVWIPEMCHVPPIHFVLASHLLFTPAFCVAMRLAQELMSAQIWPSPIPTVPTAVLYY